MLSELRFSLGAPMQNIERYVSMVYFAAFALAAWLFPRILLEVFDLIGPGTDRRIFANIPLSTLLGVALAGGLVAYLWNKPAVHEWVGEVVAQLAKVTWPNSEETRRSTMIVVLFSFVLGGLLAIMDLFGKKTLDIIFQVFS